ncbi:MAG TPA: trypsin-like peptidase domain-containing protein [Chthoniobacterales bacterium]
MPFSRFTLTAFLAASVFSMPVLAQTSAAEDPAVVSSGGSKKTKPGELVKQLNEAYISVFDRVSPSVVVIEVEKGGNSPRQVRSPFDLFPPNQRPDGNDGDPSPDQDSTEKSEGSGIICRPDGYIYTNAHVVSGDGKITVSLKDGRKFPAKVIGADTLSDVAVIKINAKDLPAAEFADSDQVRVGQIACVIGAPFNFVYSFTTGVVSAKGRSKLFDNRWSGQFEDFIQTDASINPGNSGGPLLDIEGRVIGMNTLIQGFNRGLGFSISANLLRKIGEKLIADGKIVRPWIGLSISSVSEDPENAQLFNHIKTGVVVRGIQPGTPAYRSELRPADVIQKVDGVVVEGPSDLQSEVQKKKVGQTLQLGVWREGKQLTIPVATAELPNSMALAEEDDSRRVPPDDMPLPQEPYQPEDDKQPSVPPSGKALGFENLGMQIQTLTPELAEAQKTRSKSGVIVTEIAPGSPAELAGLKVGDIITEMNAQPVTDARLFMERIKSRDTARGVLLFVERGADSQYLVLKENR